MANNQNQGNRPYRNNQNWQHEQNRDGYIDQYNQFRDNDGSFGNAGFDNDYNQGNENNRLSNNQVNQIPYNDDSLQRHVSNSNDTRRGNIGQQRNQWGTHYGASFGNQSRQSEQESYGSQSGWGSVNNYSGGYDINANDQYNDRRRNTSGLEQRIDNNLDNAYNARHGVGYGNDHANAWNNSIQSKNDKDWWDRARTDESSWMRNDEERRIPTGNNYNPVIGQHRGKGPRGYQRSDERIKEDVCDRLSDDDMLDASEIEVNVTGSEVILSGLVLSREAKRHAEDIAESVSGVRNIENRIRVGRADELEGNYTTRQILRAAGDQGNNK